MKKKNVTPSKKVINKKIEVRQCANYTLYQLYERFLHIQKYKCKNYNEKRTTKPIIKVLSFRLRLENLSSSFTTSTPFLEIQIYCIMKYILKTTNCGKIR